MPFVRLRIRRRVVASNRDTSMSPRSVVRAATKSPDGAAAGAIFFAQNCAACHGADARGGGPESLGLGGAPPDLTGLTAANGGIFPRDEVLAVIDGYGQQSFDRAMPEFGETDLGPEIVVEIEGQGTPIPARLLEVVEYLALIQR